MAGAKLGHILALVGLVLLVLSGLGGRRRPGGSPARQRWQWQAQLAGLALVLAGLVVMWAQK
jgi:drug/metabolite transporter (DMT)-like permease